MSDDTHITLPEKVSFKDRYQFTKKLGAGGMGAVHKANDIVLEKVVAVKLLLPGMSPDAVVRFHHEAKAAARLDHPNVVKVLDFGQTDAGDLYLVMDFVGSRSLEQLIKRSKFIPVESALPLFIQIAAGLQHAHSHGVLHRDVKPSNVMLSDKTEGVVQIVDFGLAKLQTEDLKLTTTGMHVGSPLYMSPEQACSENVDARSDIYSLGCLMYKALVGTPPLQGATYMETIEMHRDDSARPLNDNQFGLEFPNSLQHIIDKTLAKDPDDRYQTAGDVKDALEYVYETMRAAASPKSTESGAVEAAAKTSASKEVLSFFKTYSKPIALFAYSFVVLAVGISAIVYKFVILPQSTSTVTTYNAEADRKKAQEERAREKQAILKTISDPVANQRVVNANPEYKKLTEDPALGKDVASTLSTFNSPQMITLMRNPDMAGIQPMLRFVWLDPKLSNGWKDKEVQAFLKNPKLWREWRNDPNSPSIRKYRKNTHIDLLMRHRVFLRLIDDARFQRLVFNKQFRHLIIDNAFAYSKTVEATEAAVGRVIHDVGQGSEHAELREMFKDGSGFDFTHYDMR